MTSSESFKMARKHLASALRYTMRGLATSLKKFRKKPASVTMGLSISIEPERRGNVIPFRKRHP
jgi:hypothetical protein